MEPEKQVDNPQEPTKKIEDEVKKDVVDASQQQDYLSDLKKRDEEISRLTRDRDDYRKGMLSWKRKAIQTGEQPEEGEESSLDREEVRKILKEELLNSEIARKEAEKDSLIKKMAVENAELRATIGNKAQISNLPGGSSQETATGDGKDPGMWTREQLVYFKSKGLDPKKVAENWQKAK